MQEKKILTQQIISGGWSGGYYSGGTEDNGGVGSYGGVGGFEGGGWGGDKGGGKVSIGCDSGGTSDGAER